MKKTCLFLAFLFIAVMSKAQDIITLTNGAKIQAKVLEINPSDIKYKDFNNLDGPTITVLKDGVTSIQYANGTTSVFSDGSNPNTPPPGNFTRSSNGKPYKEGDDARGYKRSSMRNSRLHGWYFGLGIDLGACGVTSSDPNYTTTGSTYTGGNIYAVKMFSQHLGIMFGLGSEDYNYNVNFNNPAVSGYATDMFTLSRFVIPARVVYFSNSKKRTGLYAMAGFDISFLMGATDQESDDISPYYSAVSFSPYVSCGVAFRNRSARSVWMLGLFYKTSVSNAYSTNGLETYSLSLPADNSGNLHSVGLSISYMGKLGR